MRKLIYLLLITSSSLIGQVFPGAAGNGALWNFPTDYEVRIVKNLDGSGDDSLYKATTTTSTHDGIIVVFNGLSGTITLSNILQPAAGKKVYIAGQTSTNGIILKGASSFTGPLMNTSGSNDGLIMRHIVFALGATSDKNVNGDNVSFNGGTKNVIIDHCSFLWSTDENMSPYGVEGFTIQYSIVAQSLMYATHSYTTDPTSSGYQASPVGPKPHSMGSLVGNDANKITFYRTLMAHNNQRNPLIGGSVNPGVEHEIVQTIIYNPGGFGFVTSSNDSQKPPNPFYAELNYINNIIKKGPSSSNASNRQFFMGVGQYTTVYARDNITPVRTSENQDEYDAIGDGHLTTVSIGVSRQSSVPFDYPLKDEPYLTEAELNKLLTETNKVGTKFNLPPEQYVIDSYLNGTGALIDDPSDVGGYPSIALGTIIIDTNENGIPDSEDSNYSSTFEYINDLADNVYEETVVDDSSVYKRKNSLFGTIN